MKRSRPPRHHGSSLVTVILLLLFIGGGWAVWKLANRPPVMEGWLHDMDAGIQASESSDKPMLVLFTADWCPPCQSLKKNVLTDAEVAGYLRQEYVTVAIDLTQRGGPNSSIASDFGVRYIPTMFIFSPHGRELDSNSALTKPQFLNWVKTAKARSMG